MTAERLRKSPIVFTSQCYPVDGLYSLSYNTIRLSFLVVWCCFSLEPKDTEACTPGGSLFLSPTPSQESSLSLSLPKFHLLFLLYHEKRRKERLVVSPFQFDSRRHAFAIRLKSRNKSREKRNRDLSASPDRCYCISGISLLRISDRITLNIPTRCSPLKLPGSNRRTAEGGPTEPLFSWTKTLLIQEPVPAKLRGLAYILKRIDLFLPNLTSVIFLGILESLSFRFDAVSLHGY